MEAFPLHWPEGYTKKLFAVKSRFKTTLAQARDYVKLEVDRLKGKNLIISSNLPVNKNGELRADFERFKVASYGVAVYFHRKNQQVCICCDKYDQVRDNLHAIGRTLEALRQIDRDGVSDFLDKSFTGFAALPAPGETTMNFWPVLELEGPPADVSYVHHAYKQLAKIRHPDTPTGSDQLFTDLQVAYQKAIKYFS